MVLGVISCKKGSDILYVIGAQGSHDTVKHDVSILRDLGLRMTLQRRCIESTERNGFFTCLSSDILSLGYVNPGTSMISHRRPW